jgi:hypothetical protein
MSANNLNSHNLSVGANAAVDDGVLVDVGTDTGILRANGYALKLVGDGTTSALTGASASVNWYRRTEKNNITIFCQAKSSLVDGGSLALAEVTSGTSLFSIRIGNNTTNNLIYGFVGTGANVAVITKSAEAYHTMELNTWYDVALTYDAVNNVEYIYVVPSAVSSFTNFLSGASAVSDQIGSENIGGNHTPAAVWTAVSMLKEYDNNVYKVLETSATAYLQNVMIFNAYISPMEFNFLRRLCYHWNKKTGVYPK